MLFGAACTSGTCCSPTAPGHQIALAPTGNGLKQRHPEKSIYKVTFQVKFKMLEPTGEP